LKKRTEASLKFSIIRTGGQQYADAPRGGGLLRLRRERPRRGAAEQCDELAPPHELPSDEVHNLAHHWSISAPVHRSEIFPLMSVQGLGSVKTIFEVVWRNINVSKRPGPHLKFT